MWNVYQYVKDFGDNKVTYKDFINIYKSQEVLRKFISDSYFDIEQKGFIEEFKNNTNISFPNEKYANITDFILKSKNQNDLKNVCKNLMICFDKIYKK